MSARRCEVRTCPVVVTLLLAISCVSPARAGDELPAGAIQRLPVDLDSRRADLTSLAVFPDENRLAFGTSDGRAVIFDVKQQRIIREFGDRESYVEQIAVSPDGKRLAWNRDFEPVTVVDLTSGKELKCPVYEEETFSFEHVSFSPDGNQLLMITDEASASVWNFETSTVWKATQPATAAGFSPDSKVVAIGQNTVRLVEAGTGDLIRELTSVEGLVGGFVFLTSGRLAASDGSCRGSKLRVWDTESGKQIAAHLLGRAHTSADAVHRSPDGQVLALIVGGVHLQFLDPANGQIVATINLKTRGRWKMRFSGNGRRFITLRPGDKHVTTWDTAQVLGRTPSDAKRPVSQR